MPPCKLSSGECMHLRKTVQNFTIKLGIDFEFPACQAIALLLSYPKVFHKFSKRLLLIVNIINGNT